MRPHGIDQNHCHGAQTTLFSDHNTTVFAAAAALPNELIAEILVRPPVRSLLQLKRVRKSWETLISSPQFAKDHLQCSFADSTPRLAYSNIQLQNCRVGFCAIQTLFKNPSAPTMVVCFQMDAALDIVGSCNGLLCLLALSFM